VVDSDLSEDGHVDGSVVDSVAVPRSVHVDDGNARRSDDDAEPRREHGASEDGRIEPAAWRLVVSSA